MFHDTEEPTRTLTWHMLATEHSHTIRLKNIAGEEILSFTTKGSDPVGPLTIPLPDNFLGMDIDGYPTLGWTWEDGHIAMDPFSEGWFQDPDLAIFNYGSPIMLIVLVLDGGIMIVGTTEWPIKPIIPVGK